MPSRSEMLGVPSPWLVAPTERTDIEHRIKEVPTRILLMNTFVANILTLSSLGFKGCRLLQRAVICCPLFSEVGRHILTGFI